MPDGSNVVLREVEGQTVMAEKPRFICGNSKRAGRNKLTKELIVALQTRPADFTVDTRHRTGVPLRLWDRKTKMFWYFNYSLTALSHVDGCSCAGLRLGFFNGWKAEWAMQQWDKRQNPDKALPPHVHEARRLWLANNPDAS